MKKQKLTYQCQNCKDETCQWQGKCSACNEWNSLVEMTQLKKEVRYSYLQKSLPIPSICIATDVRFESNISELDRVLGGGIVKGSLTLLSGEPGVGKSTLLLNLLNQMSLNYPEAVFLYISGEETKSQIAIRAERLGITSKNIMILNDTKWENIKEEIEEVRPTLFIIDSIQTTTSTDIAGSVGSVSQVKEITYEVMNYVKEKNISSIIIGHINKNGGIAGPKVLEHMVDTVLYFEGDRYGQKRILRATKNRFGNTNEIGLFEMDHSGLNEANNLKEVNTESIPGKCITCTVQGSRSFFVEIQALVKDTVSGNPRIVCHGVDSNRVYILLAIIEKHLNIKTSYNDIYLTTNNNFKLSGRDSDLAIISAIVSSIKKKALPANKIYFGEVGLDGTIKKVYDEEKRNNEIKQFGFDLIGESTNLNEMLNIIL